MKKTKTPKKVIIIGAGISGLTTGIYLLDNGFDVTIYEKHSIAGGQCTGWNRKGSFIDGCAHWIVGTNPKSSFYPLWKHIGALNDDTKIYSTEYFSKFIIQGQEVTLYGDLKKLEEEFLRISPEDKKAIKHFIRVIKAYRHVQIPLKKPMDKMNLFSLSIMGLKMLPMVPFYAYYRKVQTTEFAQNFKSPILKELFERVMGPNYNVHSLFYTMQALSKDDAGMIEGGSRKIAFDVRDRYISQGGKLYTNASVKEVIIENNTAKGIILESGDDVYADYIVSSADAHHTMNTLLGNKYKDKFYEEKFLNEKGNPLQTCLLGSYKIKNHSDRIPKMLDFKIEPFNIGNVVIDHVSLRNYSFDKTLNTIGNEVLGALIMLDDDSLYHYFKNLSKQEYIEIKKEIGLKLLSSIQKQFSLEEYDIELLDLATPLTYERYTNAYHGSYMSFITTKKTKGLMRPGLVKGLNNFIMAGQWLMPPGGLPIALFTGKHAAYRIARMEKQRFIDLDDNYKFVDPIVLLKDLNKKIAK